MKTLFFGYYPPTDAEYMRIWNEATIVLDTNILLNLYRLPTIARDDLLNVLDILKDRLWIPYHVALEFQKRRLDVIATERKSTEDTLRVASELVSNLKDKVDKLQIDKRGLGIQSQSLFDDLDKANKNLIDAITSAHNEQLDISSCDPVRESLDRLLNGRIGICPTSQEELDELIFEGDERYNERIPPGFADAIKDRSQTEAIFIHDHIKYHRKFGDLIIWRQIIQHAKTTEIKALLFITADKKEDWWWEKQGKTIGPHPELVREIMRESNVELFWMYSSVQFVEHANKYAAASMSSQSVDELKQVDTEASTRSYSERDIVKLESEQSLQFSRIRNGNKYYDRAIINLAEDAVGRWLMLLYDSVRYNMHKFPDFMTIDGGYTHGFEVKLIRNFNERMIPPYIVSSLFKGYLETREGRLSKFTLVIVVSEDDFLEISKTDRIHEIENRLARLLEKYPVSGIIVGVVLNDKFEPIVFHKNRTFEIG